MEISPITQFISRIIVDTFKLTVQGPSVIYNVNLFQHFPLLILWKVPMVSSHYMPPSRVLISMGAHSKVYSLCFQIVWELNNVLIYLNEQDSGFFQAVAWRVMKCIFQCTFQCFPLVVYFLTQNFRKNIGIYFFSNLKHSYNARNQVQYTPSLPSKVL